MVFSEFPFDFLDKKLKRGDLLGTGAGDCSMAGESLRSSLGRSDGAKSGVGIRVCFLEAGDGENAESTLGDPCLDDDLGENPKRLRRLVDVAEPLVSCDGVLL